MNSEFLFSQALGLQSPWKVEEINFSNDSTLEQTKQPPAGSGWVREIGD
ncbi:MAG: hypothetical protein HOK14_04715 [Gammaproteobacteria bacterium]|nr:hypothetical protein [Gammaproteobacteria bacterium]